jgi:hypothetical protein
MDQNEWQKQARYMLDTRTVNTIGDYMYFHRDYYWSRGVLWAAALAVFLITKQPYLILPVVGFCLGWLLHHFRSLSGLAHQNAVLDYFVDWPKVEATAAAQTESATK